MKTESQKMRDLNDLATRRGLNAKPVTPQLPPLAGMTPLGLKPQTDKATNRPWKSEKTFYGECATDSLGKVIFTACVDNGKAEGGYLAPERKANIELAVQAVNEHAALVAVEEGMNKIGIIVGSNRQTRLWEIKKVVEETLANLATVRGESEGGK